jgi:hypothetical protein
LTTYIHGQANCSNPSRLYKLWRDILQRCYNPKRENYKYYGGQGIKVCDDWRTFLGFEDGVLEEIGPHPGRGWTFNRIDTKKDYGPDNVYWKPLRRIAMARQSPNGRPLVGARLHDTKALKARGLSPPPARYELNQGPSPEAMMVPPEAGGARPHDYAPDPSPDRGATFRRAVDHLRRK